MPEWGWATRPLTLHWPCPRQPCRTATTARPTTGSAPTAWRTSWPRAAPACPATKYGQRRRELVSGGARMHSHPPGPPLVCPAPGLAERHFLKRVGTPWSSCSLFSAGLHLVPSQQRRVQMGLWRPVPALLHRRRRLSGMRYRPRSCRQAVQEGGAGSGRGDR